MLSIQARTALDKIEQTAMIIAAGLLLFTAILLPADLVGFFDEKEMYAAVHQLDTTQSNWEWQYIQTHFYIGVFVLTGLTIITLRWVKRNSRTIRTLNLSSLLFFFVTLIVGFVNWMNSDFDH